MGEQRYLMVGAGGWAGTWVRAFLPAFQDRMRLVGLVDVDQHALDQAGDLLALPPAQRFLDLRAAFAATAADFCIVCLPPHLRREAVALAVERGMHILCEKPIADTWHSCLDILRTVTDAGLKMAVVQNYRFNKPFLTIRRILEVGTLGRVNSIACRFAADYNQQNVGGAFRHQVPDAMLYEGSVHHFDQLRYLAGSDCAWIAGRTWNPAWSPFANDTCGLFVAEMTNGVMCQYEVNNVASGTQNDWHREHYRLECEHGAIDVGRDGVGRTFEHSGRPGGGCLRVTEIEPVSGEDEGHYRIIDDFLSWLDGGPKPQTAIDDNIRTAAMAFSAIEAAASGGVVDVRAMVRAAGV